MITRTRRSLMVSVALITAVALLLVVPGTVVRAADDNSIEVSQMLSQAKTQAVQLREDAYELWLYTQVPPSASSANEISPDSHNEAIRQISTDVSNMTIRMDKLQAARKLALPWQRAAIDSIAPLVKQLVDSTNALVVYNDKNPTLTRSDEYKDYVEANADQAQQLAALITTYVDYGKTRDRLEKLRSKLGMGGAASR